MEGNLATTAGTCAVMGTASTMACLTEALGMGLKDSAAIPAVHADRLRMAEASGRRAAQMALTGGPRPSEIITQRSVENALRVLLAIGGSTNAMIHLTAVAGRRGIAIDLKRLNQLSDETPVLVDLKPTGQHYLQDLHAAGGLSALLWELRDLLHLDCRTVEGGTLGERLAAPPAYVDHAVVRRREEPIDRGWRAGGAVRQPGAWRSHSETLGGGRGLFEREARAVVFESLQDLSERIDDPALDVTVDDFLVLKNAGPRSPSGMPEAGYLPIPKKLAQAGVKDMVRISDARMSGTAYGTVVLHVTPDAASGGPLALVRNGDRIALSVRDKRIDVLVPAADLERRRAGWSAPQPPARGYARLYAESILQADLGCDFGFLRGV